MQDVFAKIAQAQSTKGGSYITDGDYLYLIESFTMNQGHEGTCFVAELYVAEAKQTEPDAEPNAVGTTVSMVQNVTKHESALGNVKAFVLAAIGLDEASATTEQVQEALRWGIDGTQPMRGIAIRNNTYRKVNQGRKNPANQGKIMTLNRWIHVPGQTGETIAQGRAHLDSLTGGAPASQSAQPAEPAPAPAQPAPAGVGTSPQTPAPAGVGTSPQAEQPASPAPAAGGGSFLSNLPGLGK